MTVTRDTFIYYRTISDDGARAKLAGTPLAPWTELFIAYSYQYQIDPNWIVSYLQWETGFGAAGPGGVHFSMLFNDPWDMLCGKPAAPCGAPSHGAVECRRAVDNGYCYDVYPTMEQGIEAGFIDWQSYVARGWVTWFSSLSVALCGNPDGCSGQWVDNVIGQANDNQAQWPYEDPQPPPPPPHIEATAGFTVVVGLGFLAGGAITYWNLKGRPPLASLLRP